MRRPLRRDVERARAVLVLAAVAALVAACSSADAGSPTAPPGTPTTPPAPEAAPPGAPTRLEQALLTLPDAPALRRHVLFGDLAALRRAYGDDWDGSGLVGVWLPDALAATDRRPWQATFGAALERVDAFAAAGFHPRTVAVATGSFPEDEIRRSLRRAGYAPRAGQLTRGGDGSVDPSTPAGRLVLGALNRIVVTDGRVVAASTTALARAAVGAGSPLGDHPQLSAAADALGPVTAAVLQDAELVRPPAGTPTRVIATREATVVGVGVDDRAARGATLRIALVYASPEDARAEAVALDAATLAGAELPGAGERRLGDVATGWRSEAIGRAVRLEATLAAGQSVGVWRSLLESGDLAVLVRVSGAVIR